MGRELVLVRHGEDPPDDRAYVFARRAGFAPLERYPFKGELLGSPSRSTAGTVIYGGPFNVYEEDRHPFLVEERRWILECIEAGVPVLGFCQGAQQIAWALGAQVGPKPDERYEFGYYEVRPTEEAGDFMPGPIVVTQAHFHTFGIPEGAVRLAESDAFENQAFRYKDNVYAFQFHAECTIEGFRRWQAQPWAAFGKLGAQTREEQDRLMAEHDAAQADWFYRFLERLFGTP